MVEEPEFKYVWHFEWIDPERYIAMAIRKIYFIGYSKYQFVEVVELPVYGKTLILDGKVQSSVTDEWIYHEALVHPVMIAHPHPESVLVLGGGEGAVLREVLKHKTVKKVIMVDIDKEVIKIAKEYLKEWHKGSFENPKVSLIIADGRKYIEQSKEKFDVIILDLTDPTPGGPSYKLYTYEFYSALKNNALKEDGIVVTQATSCAASPKVHGMIYNTLKKVFKVVRTYNVHIPSFHTIWSFIAASDTWDPGKLSQEEINKRISERVEGELKFYDGETHMHMFNLPKHVRRFLKEFKEVAYDEKPPLLPL